MINSKTLKEYVNSFFDNDKEPNSKSIQIRKVDNTFWTIKINEKVNNNIEIKVNNILMGYFVETTQPTENQYVCTFYKNDKNCKKNSEYYNLIKCRFENFNVFTTKT